MHHAPPSPTLRERLANLPPPQPDPEIDPDDLDLDALKVVARLRRHGYEAYLVGGCVRDLLSGAHPKDYDVATSAHPDEIRDVFRNSRLIGRRFRLAHVFFPGGRFVEVATFRATPVSATEEPVDGEAVDLLVTDDNQFGTAQEDALRRDFTVNGLFYDAVEGRVIDFVGGRADLETRTIRTIGDPEIRLREDPVRGLRAARIAAKLGFAIDPETFAAMARHAGELPRCAAARVLEETLKLLRSGASRNAFGLLRKAGILAVLLPAVEKALSRGGAEAMATFDARLDALDGLVRRGAQVSDAVMLATILSVVPAGRAPEPAPEAGEDADEPAPLAPMAPGVDRILSQLSQHARLPRRIADRVRAILAAQPAFLAPPRKKRRRGGGGGMVRAPHFPEALQLFEVEVIASGRHADVLERWRQKLLAALAEPEPPVLAEAPQPGSAAIPGPVPEASAGDEGEEGEEAEETPEAPKADGAAPAKKRRRRGGRRRRKGPGEGTPPPADPAP